MACAGVREQPVGEPAALGDGTLRRHLGDNVVHAQHDHGDIAFERTLLLEQGLRVGRCEAGARDEMPFDADAGARGQHAAERQRERAVLRRDADAGGRRIADDKKAQQRPAADAARARPFGLTELGCAATRAFGLRDEQGQQEQLYRAAHIGTAM